MQPSTENDPPSFGGFVPDHARLLFKSGQNERALQYIGEFVMRGNTYAMLAMADYQYDQSNTEASLSWVAKVEQAAAAGDYEACIYLSSAYQRGLGAGTPQERQAKSLLMLERAAEQGYVSCAHALMSNYLYGLNGAPVSKERFAYWAHRASSYGSVSAQEALRKLQDWPNVAPGSE
jgi:TPR repeat protein